MKLKVGKWYNSFDKRQKQEFKRLHSLGVDDIPTLRDFILAIEERFGTTNVKSYNPNLTVEHKGKLYIFSSLEGWVR